VYLLNNLVSKKLVKIRVKFEDNNILKVQCVVTFSNVLI
jgi:hypothetical protein